MEDVISMGVEKMYLHADRIAANQRGELPAPVTVELDLTNKCDHACPGCSFSYLVNIDKSEFDFDRAFRLISELADLGCKGLTFSGGGEPFMYGSDRLYSLMLHASDQGMSVGLITNGSKLEPRFLDVCTWIRVSLDAYDVVTFRRFHGHGQGMFDRVCQNIKCVLKQKLESESKCTVGVGFLTDEDSLPRRDIPKFSKFCSEQFPGLNYAQFRPLVTNRVADPSLRGGHCSLYVEELRAIELDVAEAMEEFGSETLNILWSRGKYHALSEPDFGVRYSRCLAHFLQVTISADQRAYICCHGQGSDDFCLGDLTNQTFLEVWEGEKAKEVRRTINPKTDCPPACRLHLQNAAMQRLSEVGHKDFI